jgi:hypothetical protein
MAILAVDVGGTRVAVLVRNQTEARRFASGATSALLDLFGRRQASAGLHLVGGQSV